MKFDNLNIIDILIKNDLIPIIENTREYIGSLYDTSSEGYKYFKGLCDISCEEVIDTIKEKMFTKYSINDLNIHTIHGEQRHLPRILSKFWGYEHTWIVFKLSSYKIYIDPTSGQFKELYDDIPDYYISTIPPKWYIPDRKNPIFGNKLFRSINDIITIKRNIGIIEYIYYDIWGIISDKIYNKKINKRTFLGPLINFLFNLHNMIQQNLSILQDLLVNL